jgi:hypothetical protein
MGACSSNHRRPTSSWNTCAAAPVPDVDEAKRLTVYLIPVIRNGATGVAEASSKTLTSGMVPMPVIGPLFIKQPLSVMDQL